ncbi:MAG: hypothetical protein AM325_006595 [Candidatus Thorarchaeota archaeon SMTZ1-45]|nr:MAG: hypothetical protein AM325_08345 [Candidatus Thorarchaeota archaeon SMTZ1-45]
MSEYDSSNYQKRKTRVVAVSLIIALFAPVGITLISHPYGAFAANLIGVFWMVFIGTPIPVDGGGMVPPTVDPTAGIMVVPLIALRLLFVFLLYRAYNGQTSRRSAILLGVLSELYLVIINIPSYISSITTLSIGGLYLPLPILLLVGALMVWKFPPFVPSKPWEAPG